MMVENSGVRTSGEPSGQLAVHRGARESVIDHECFFEGTFRTPGNMRIEGAYQGVIECQGTLTIAESGQVKARIAAGNLAIAGQFQGEALCEARFEILKTGRVTGTIAARSTVVHEGAFFEGEIRMGNGREPAAAPVQAARSAISEQAAPSPGITPTVPSRRRPIAAELPASPQPDAATPEAAEPDVPRVNGRSQPNRDATMPNRTSEEGQ
jgi:cytoskeletal protein CcmA (bactofilin family)